MQIFICMVLGILVGYLFHLDIFNGIDVQTLAKDDPLNVAARGVAGKFQILSDDIFMRLVKMIIVPLCFFWIITIRRHVEVSAAVRHQKSFGGYF